jgi:cobalt-zinc-cadmium efflux system outer membrane protein
VCFLLCSALAVAQQTPPTSTTVDELVHTGIANNKDLAAIRERIAQMQGQARQARVRPSPTLELSGATAEPFGTAHEHEYGAGLSQPIETFGKRGKRVRVADIAVAMAQAEADERAAQLAYEIRAAYAVLLSERRKLKQLDSLIALNQETLRLTEARVKEGDVAALEASLLKVEIGRSALARRSAQGRLVSAENELRRLTGLNRDAVVPDIDFAPPPATPLDALQQQALKQRADLNSARLEEQQQSAGLALTRAEWKPDVTVSAAYSRQNSAFEGLYAINGAGVTSPIRDQVNSLNFSVSIPLRTPRSNAGAVQAAGARTAEARLRREQLEHAIPLEVESAYERWRSTQDVAQSLETSVLNASAANLAVMREAYSLGQLRLLDVLNEQRRLTDTQMQFIDAQADLARTWAELERASGGLLP